jgi:hypothetical protein
MNGAANPNRQVSDAPPPPPPLPSNSSLKMLTFFQVGVPPEVAQLTTARLNDAAWLDDDRLKSLYGLFQVNKDHILHQGFIKQETGFSLTSTNSMQSRFFVIYIDHAWRPHISYHKERFETSSACEPGCRPDALGSHSLAAFTFTPTKKSRNSDNLRSWRIDFKDQVSANKCDKLVLEFISDKDCHEWQAALSLCKTGLQSFAEGRAQSSAQTEPPVTIASTLRESKHTGPIFAPTNSQRDAAPNPLVLSGQLLALDVPSIW